MIRLLAKFFRGLHMVLGFTVPLDSYDERKFVLVWLGAIAAFIGTFVLLFLFIAKMYTF
jgi:hypothetical protein